MKVKELIEKLQKMDPELPVYVADPGCGCCSGGDYEAAEPTEGEETVWGADGTRVKIKVVSIR